MLANIVKAEPLAAIFAACVALVPALIGVYDAFAHTPLTDAQTHAIAVLVAAVGVIAARSQVTPNRP